MTEGPAHGEARIRILAADDHPLLREALVLLLTRRGLAVAGVAGNGDDLVSQARVHNPDVVIADIRMAPTYTDEGLRAALAIRESNPAIAILVLSQHLHYRIAAELLESRNGGGGTGYLLKQRVADSEAFCSDLKRIAAGATVVDPEVVAAMLGRPRRDDPVDRLSPRHRDVLASIAEGHGNATIARRLGLTPTAVTRHVSEVFAELGLPPAADDHERVLSVVRYLNR